MPNTVVLVSSWDRNKRLWPVVKHSFDKYWSDCPYPIYFITNFENAPIGKTITVGKECGWASNTLNALKTFECKNIIWMLDDYWFSGPINNVIKKYVLYVDQGKTSYIRLMPSAIETRLPFQYDSSLHHYPMNSPHKTSLGPSIWNKDLLQRLILPEENIWNFEGEAVNRTTRQDVFLFAVDNRFFRIAGPHYPNSPYTEQMMVRGQLTLSAYQYFQNEGIVFEDKNS